MVQSTTQTPDPDPLAKNAAGSTTRFTGFLASFFLALAAIVAALPACFSFTSLGPVPDGPLATMITAVVSIACYLTIGLVIFYRESLGRVFAWKAPVPGFAGGLRRIGVSLLPLLLAVISTVSFVFYLELINADIDRLRTDPAQLSPDTMLAVVSTYIVGFVCAVGLISLVGVKEYYLSEAR